MPNKGLKKWEREEIAYVLYCYESGTRTAQDALRRIREVINREDRRS